MELSLPLPPPLRIVGREPKQGDTVVHFNTVLVFGRLAVVFVFEEDVAFTESIMALKHAFDSWRFKATQDQLNTWRRMVVHVWDV
jgi:hypothetical protein